MFRQLLFLMCCLMSGSPAGALSNGAPIENIPGVNTETPYKFLALVIINYQDGQKSRCAGVLITRTFVLTAGHCLQNAQSVDVYFYSGTDGSDHFTHRPAIDWVKHWQWNVLEAALKEDWGNDHDSAVILIGPAPSWNVPIDVAFEYDPAEHEARPLYIVSQATPDFRLARFLISYFKGADGKKGRNFFVDFEEPRDGLEHGICRGDSGAPVIVIQNERALLVGLGQGLHSGKHVQKFGKDEEFECGPDARLNNVTFDKQSFLARAETLLLSRNKLASPVASKVGAREPAAGARQDDGGKPKEGNDGGQSKQITRIAAAEDAAQQPYEACTERDTNRDSDACTLSLRLQGSDMIERIRSLASAQDGGPYERYAGFYAAQCPTAFEDPKMQFVSETSLGDGTTFTEILGLGSTAVWFSGKNVIYEYNFVVNKLAHEEFSLVKKLDLKAGLSPAIRTKSGMTIVLMPSLFLQDVNINDDPLRPKAGFKKCGLLEDYLPFLRTYINYKIDNPYFQQGQRYLDGRQLEGALLNFKKAAEAGPTWRASYMVAKVQFEMQQYVEAFGSVNAALQGAPSAAQVYELRGLINEQMAAPDAAIADFRKAIELGPNISSTAKQHLGKLIAGKSTAH